MTQTSFEWAREDECRALLAEVARDEADVCGPDLAAEAIGLIMDLYPAREMNNAGAFLEYAVMALCGLPADVVVKLAHPSFGIARTSKFLPSIAEIVQWCEKETEARESAAKAARSRLYKLEQRKRLMVGPVIDKPKRLSGDTWKKAGAETTPAPSADTTASQESTPETFPSEGMTKTSVSLGHLSAAVLAKAIAAKKAGEPA